MKTYKVVWHEKTIKDLRKINRSDAKRIVNKVEKVLSEDPINYSKRLTGPLNKLYRYRIGDYRVVYEMDGDTLIVLVLRVAHRNKV